MIEPITILSWSPAANTGDQISLVTHARVQELSTDNHPSWFGENRQIFLTEPGRQPARKGAGRKLDTLDLTNTRTISSDGSIDHHRSRSRPWLAQRAPFCGAAFLSAARGSSSFWPLAGPVVRPETNKQTEAASVRPRADADRPRRGLGHQNISRRDLSRLTSPRANASTRAVAMFGLGVKIFHEREMML